MNIKLIIAAILSALLITGLSLYAFFRDDPASSPSEALAAFHDHVMNGEIDQAKEYLPEAIRTAWDNGTQPWYAGTFGEFMKDHQEKYKSIKPISEQITGQTARVKADVIYYDNSSEIKEYLLIQEDGEWKIGE